MSADSISRREIIADCFSSDREWTGGILSEYRSPLETREVDGSISGSYEIKRRTISKREFEL